RERRPAPAGAARRTIRERAPRSDGHLPELLQAALRPRPELHLRPRGPGRLLPRIPAHDGALARSAAGPRARRGLRERRGRPRTGSAAPPRLLLPAVARRLPALLRDGATDPHRELGAGAPADLPRCRRPLETLRLRPRFPARAPRRLNRIASSPPEGDGPPAVGRCCACAERLGRDESRPVVSRKTAIVAG